MKNVYEGDLTAKAGEVYPYTEVTGNVYAYTMTAFDAGRKP